jgi:long-chain-fatty-acid--CoA ligase ACSBG
MGAIMAGGFSVGIYTTNSSDACKYIADNCKANIIVVEDDKQLEKVLKFKAELTSINVRISTIKVYSKD